VLALSVRIGLAG